MQIAYNLLFRCEGFGNSIFVFVLAVIFEQFSPLALMHEALEHTAPLTLGLGRDLTRPAGRCILASKDRLVVCVPQASTFYAAVALPQRVRVSMRPRFFSLGTSAQLAGRGLEGEKSCPASGRFLARVSRSCF